MKDMTMCTDNGCHCKGECMRWSTSSNVEWRFTESPRKGESCDMFWGRNQQNILDKPESIVKGEEK